MVRTYSYIVLLLLALALTGGIYEYQKDSSDWLAAPAPLSDSLLKSFQQQKTSIGTTEDPLARQRWEWLMLRDPKTGEVPRNIRQRELHFAEALPVAKKNAANVRFADTDWQSAGPFNVAGRTRALAIDVRDENILLAAGVSGGMWRSTDGGASWVKTTNPMQLQSVTSLVQDTRAGKENIWYYGSGESIGNSARGGEAPYRGDGIYKSIDNGLTWLPLPATSTNEPQLLDQPFDYVYTLKINPANAVAQELYAAALGGIYKSVNEGRNWTALLADGNALFTDVEVSSTGVLYASLSSIKLDNSSNSAAGLYRSANGGLSWENITPAGWPEQFGRTIISINPQNQDEVFFLASVPLNDNSGGDQPMLWRYNHATTGQGTWIDLTDNLPEQEAPVAGLELQGGYNMVLEVHPQNPEVVFVGGTNLYRSSNGFTSAEQTAWIGGYSAENEVQVYANQHPDQHALVFYPSNPAQAIAGHDGGLSYTDNILAEEVDWTYLNNGYVTTQFYTVGLDQSQVNDLFIGGMQDNGSFLTPDASSTGNWVPVLGGDGGYTHVASKGAYYYVSFQNSQIYRLTLNSDYTITSFARVDPVGAGTVEGQRYLFVNPYVFDPEFRNRMYLAAGDVIYRNRNISQIPSGGQLPTTLNWERLDNTQVRKGSISALSISTVPANVLYYGTSEGSLYKATDVNTTDPQVTRITSELFPEQEGYVAHIAINPTNADELVVVFSNYSVRSIFHSTNGGQTFTDISGNLEEFPDGSGSGPSVRQVEIIPLTTGGSLFLAGTSTGLYSTRMLAGIQTVWEQEAPELIGRVVVPQIRVRSIDGRVAIATHGNGVYYKNFSEVRNTYIDPVAKPLALLTPYPNPFTDRLTIPFELPRDGVVRIRLYDTKGVLIKYLYYNREFAGTSEITWDGRNNAGVPLPSGMYLLRMDYEDQTLARRVVLLR